VEGGGGLYVAQRKEWSHISEMKEKEKKVLQNMTCIDIFDTNIKQKVIFK
jgi:hypothetical protein